MPKPLPAPHDLLPRPSRRRASGPIGLVLVALAISPTAAPAQDRAETPDPDHLPPALAPFEHLPGAWSGVGIPPANRLKGWPESHAWSLVFVEGKPAALAVEMTGNTRLKSGVLRAGEPAASGAVAYRLEATTTDGTVVPYSGTFDADASPPTLTLEEEAAPPAGAPAHRLVLRLLTNGEGYTLWDEQRRPGASSFVRAVETRMSRGDGKRRGDGDDVAGPRCIISGGAATLTVSYQGRTFPVCCTGCREQFLAQPERYLAKLAAKAGAPGPDAAPTPAAQDEEPPAAGPDAPKAKAAAKKAPAAADLLKQAQKLERDGKRGAALAAYRSIVAKHPRSPEAKQAAGRIKALAGRR